METDELLEQMTAWTGVQKPLFLPNSIFTTTSREDPSRMLNRRIYETIGMRYRDIAQMESIVVDVSRMLEEHEAIDTKQMLMVNFVSFGPSWSDFFIYCFTKTTSLAKFYGIKKDVLLAIAKIIEARGAEIAFPTSSAVHVSTLLRLRTKVPQYHATGTV